MKVEPLYRYGNNVGFFFLTNFGHQDRIQCIVLMTEQFIVRGLITMLRASHLLEVRPEVTSLSHPGMTPRVLSCLFRTDTIALLSKHTMQNTMQFMF